MSLHSTRTEGHDQRLDQVIADFLRLRSEGREPDREDLLRRHPDLAADLTRFFADQDGFGIDEARPAIALTHGLRNATPVGVTGRAHEMLSRRRP